MSGFRLRDWNDVSLLIACAEKGSFASAASSLGLDQTTVSRRIGHLEQVVGRPLFFRRRSGATPTLAGLAMLERARAIHKTINEFEDALTGLENLPSPVVVVGASEGLLTYVLIPVLLGTSQSEQPLDASVIRRPLPKLAFTTRTTDTDIAIIATSPGILPDIRGAAHVQRIGTMHFKPVAGRSFLETKRPLFGNFDDLINHPLLDVDIYHQIKSLDGWNSLIEHHKNPQMIIKNQSTQSMHHALVEGKGFGILPTYSRMYDSRIEMLGVSTPPMMVSLWLTAHEDKLREPVVRTLFDTISDLFMSSPWFKERNFCE